MAHNNWSAFKKRKRAKQFLKSTFCRSCVSMNFHRWLQWSCLAQLICKSTFSLFRSLFANPAKKKLFLKLPAKNWCIAVASILVWECKLVEHASHWPPNVTSQWRIPMFPKWNLLKTAFLKDAKYTNFRPFNQLYVFPQVPGFPLDFFSPSIAIPVNKHVQACTFPS